MCTNEKKGPTFEEMIKGYITYRTEKEKQYDVNKQDKKNYEISNLTKFYDDLLT